MTYALLRHNGVDVGKRDFLGARRVAQRRTPGKMASHIKASRCGGTLRAYVVPICRIEYDKHSRAQSARASASRTNCVMFCGKYTRCCRAERESDHARSCAVLPPLLLQAKVSLSPACSRRGQLELTERKASGARNDDTRGRGRGRDCRISRLAIAIRVAAHAAAFRLDVQPRRRLPVAERRRARSRRAQPGRRGDRSADQPRRPSPTYELGMEDGRIAIFLAIRAPRGDLVGIVMILADMKSMSEDTDGSHRDAARCARSCRRSRCCCTS